jgi:hypothetical protein
VTRGPVAATIERGWREMAEIDAAFERGEIDQAGWHARVAALLVPAYLRGGNPRAQSGYGGDEAEWRQARSLVAEAIPRSGTFLDVGCASGLLMECVAAWCAERGLAVEPYGVDIAPELVRLACTRLPQWADRIFEGNAATWRPPLRFTVVRAGLEYVPRPRRGAFLLHLLEHAVEPGGRLVVGPTIEERDETRAGPSLEETVCAAGLRVGGRIERPHPRDDRVMRRLVWVDVA